MSLRVLIADDEALARSRLRTLLSDIAQPACHVVAEVASVGEVLHALAQQPVDVLLLDIAMPGGDGMQLAQYLYHQQRNNTRPPQGSAPAVIFVTAHAEHAVRAFEIEAVDYLTKPVRLERLQAALDKVQRKQPGAAVVAAAEPAPATPDSQAVLAIPSRNGVERVPLSQVLYFKAELKYITVVTERREYIWDAALHDLEQRYAQQFLRIHRNALVARDRLGPLLRPGSPEWENASLTDPHIGDDTWGIRVLGVDTILAVSRRQLPLVREQLK